MPLENVAPTSIPIEAMTIITLNGATFEPMAELRKFTASLLTPTTRSDAANKNRITTNIK